MKKAKVFQTKKNYAERLALDLQTQFDIQNLKIQEDDIKSSHDPVLAAINTFQNNRSVNNIKQREFNSIFSFKNANENDVRKNIKNLNVPKACEGSYIPTKTIKLNIDLFGSFICQHFNYYISTGEFPNELKHAGVIPGHKKRINVIKLAISQ